MQDLIFLKIKLALLVHNLIYDVKLVETYKLSGFQ